MNIHEYSFAALISSLSCVFPRRHGVTLHFNHPLAALPLSMLVIEVQPCVPCPYRGSAQRPLSDRVFQTRVMKSHRAEPKNPSDKLSALFSLLSRCFNTDFRIFSPGESLHWECMTDNKAHSWYCHVSAAWCCLQPVPLIWQWLCAKYIKLWMRD